MSSYLPKDSSGTETYAEGGGLYAIGERSVSYQWWALFCVNGVLFFLLFLPSGLIHANHGSKVIDYLSQELRSNSSEVSELLACILCQA